MPEAARARFIHGDRFADQGGCAFEVDLRLDRKSKTRLDDYIPVVGGWPGPYSRPVGAETVGMDQHAAAFGAARLGKPHEFINQAANGIARFYPIQNSMKTFDGDVRSLPVRVGIFAAN